MESLRNMSLRQAKEHLGASDPLQALEWLQHAPQSPETRVVEAQARYRLASQLARESRFDSALRELRRIPTDSPIPRFLIEERIGLLTSRSATTFDLREMARRFGKECDSCRGKDLYTIATCTRHTPSMAPARRLPPDCLAPAIQGAYAAAAYRSRWTREWDRMSDFIRSTKSEVQRPAVRFAGYLLTSYMCRHTPLVGSADAVVPIPTSPSRTEARGGCIPLVLAETIRDTLAIPIREPIQPSSDYEDHQHVRGAARARALRHAWVVRQDPVLQGRQVVLVDDIITTGVTMKTAASMLLDQGVKGVFALGLFHTESK